MKKETCWRTSHFTLKKEDQLKTPLRTSSALKCTYLSGKVYQIMVLVKRMKVQGWKLKGKKIFQKKKHSPKNWTNIDSLQSEPPP